MLKAIVAVIFGNVFIRIAGVCPIVTLNRERNVSCVNEIEFRNGVFYTYTQFVFLILL
jgi:hypothetical protein